MIKNFFFLLILMLFITPLYRLTGQVAVPSGKSTFFDKEGNTYVLNSCGTRLDEQNRIIIQHLGTMPLGISSFLHSGKLFSIDSQKLSIDVGHEEQQIIDFKITNDTQYCDGTKMVNLAFFKPEMEVTIVCDVMSSEVFSLKRGLLESYMTMSGTKFLSFTCIEDTSKEPSPKPDSANDPRIKGSKLTIGKLLPENKQVDFSIVAGITGANGEVNFGTSEFGGIEVEVNGYRDGFVAVWGLPYNGKVNLKYPTEPALCMVNGPPVKTVYKFINVSIIEFPNSKEETIVILSDEEDPLKFILLERGLIYYAGTGIVYVGLEEYLLPEKNSPKLVIEHFSFDQIGFWSHGLMTAEKYDKAFPYLLEAANRGNGQAQGKVGEMYYFGQGVPQNYTQARKWFESAAANNVGSGFNGLGMLYRYGHGVTPDEVQAIQYFDKGISEGSVMAAMSLASIAEEKGLLANAIEIYKICIKSGHEEAKSNIDSIMTTIDLFGSIEDGEIEEVQNLLAGKAKVNLPDHDGFTALHYNANSILDCVSITKLLLDAGARINHQDTSKRTALYVASYVGNVAIVIHLLASGADPELSDITGLTPLMMGVEQEKLPIVKALLEAGAKVNAVSDNGDTALSFARKGGNEEIINLLLQNGAREN